MLPQAGFDPNAGHRVRREVDPAYAAAEIGNVKLNLLLIF